jgi:hypothetical protein
MELAALAKEIERAAAPDLLVTHGDWFGKLERSLSLTIAEVKTRYIEFNRMPGP